MFARNSPHKAVCDWTISRLVHVLSLAGIVPSTLKVTEPGQLQHLRPNYRVCQPKKSEKKSLDKGIYYSKALLQKNN